MTTRARGLRASPVVVIAALTACARGHAPALETNASLGGDVVATVGAVPVTASLVGRVAGAEGISPRAALERVVADALAAEGARARGLDRTPEIAWRSRAVLARAVADRIEQAARAAGPPSDAEVAELTAQHWKELDAPEAVRVIHAVVMRKEKPKPGDDERARAIAAEIAKSEAAAISPEDFEARAKAVPHEGFEVKVERLPAIVADGRSADPGIDEVMDPTFTRAAFALGAPGTPAGTSGVVETPFGWHVLRMIERVPPKRASLEARRAQLTDEAIARRGHAAIDRTLGALRARTPIEVMSDAEASMRGVAIDRLP